MFIKEIKNQEIYVSIPLTDVTGKIRIKKRNNLSEYGKPVATRSTALSDDCYVEWQIGYDVAVTDEKKMQHTTLKDVHFTSYKEIEKTLYELSEYIKYFYDWKIISKNELLNIKSYFENLKDTDFLDSPIGHPELGINRKEFVEKQIGELNFSYSQVQYPLLISKFENSEIFAEITITEKQRAVGTQPMLFLCFPISVLENSANLIGRTANAKEHAIFKITKDNISVFLKVFKIFGTLTKSHNTDTIRIIERIIK